MTRKKIKGLMGRILFAFAFLTIIPGLGRLKVLPEDTGKSTVFYPVVGFTLGLTLSALYLLTGLFPFTRAVILCVFSLLFSRGVHADGLIDTIDGFLSGRKGREEILKVMRDSRLGALGFIGAFSLYTLKIALFYELLSAGGAASAPLWFLLAVPPVLSRGHVALACLLFPYGGGERGLGKSFVESVGVEEAVISFIIMEGISIVGGDPFLLLLPPAVSMFWLGWSALCLGKIGGITGDTLGAGIELSEVFALVLIRIFFL